MALNILPDPSKKASINSLLNPQDASSFPAHLPNLPPPLASAHPSHHQNASLYPQDYHNSSYHLRAASWEEGRKAIDSTHPPRQYQPHIQSDQAHVVSSQMYPNPHQPQPYMRQRIDSNASYSSDRSLWPSSSHQDPVQVSYPPQQVPSVYSDGRGCGYTSPYENLSVPASMSADPYQTADRASVRLVARQAMQPPADSGATRYGSQIHDYPSAYSQPPQPTTTLPQTPPQVDVSSQPPSNKRPLPEGDEASNHRTKRAKSKPKSAGSSNTTTSTATTTTTTLGASKRGYNAKKRSETALITAQNDAIQRARSDAKGKERAPLDARDSWQDTSSSGGPIGSALIPELQAARCMSNRYRNDQFPRCVSCTRRWAGDTCRFQGIRFFLRDSNKAIQGISFGENHPQLDTPTLEFPKVWNRRLDRIHIKRSKLCIAKALLPALKKELEHIKVQEIVRRPRETEVRATCDTCMTSLFSNSWMCRQCGREICADCFELVQELTAIPSNPTPDELANSREGRERFAHSNPFFLSCTRRSEHEVTEFTPVTRFQPAELIKSIQEMEALLANPGSTSTDSTTTPPLSRPRFIEEPPIYDDYTPLNTPSNIASIPILRAQILPASLFDEPAASYSLFAPLWSRGVPVMFKNLMSRFKINWTPEYFSQHHGDTGCIVIESQTDASKKTTVRDFFSDFGKYDSRGPDSCWKLKDWPPTADFKIAFPELYDDFSQAVPVPDYVRRDGVYNIGSHFPSNTIGPDLGPKMYNAMASSQERGSRGSTRLHMDMADALNVMLYAEKCADGTEGYAVWDLFKAEDSQKIRQFLRKHFGPGSPHHEELKAKSTRNTGLNLNVQDPIHVQQYYLDVELRQALFEEHGVKSYRIYQRPGDGIFIPAGCAHQVANMSDCIKIAIDFVSPENIHRCEKLTQEFRAENKSKVWKEDVLQLRTMMWFAWQSCSLKGKELGPDPEDQSPISSRRDKGDFGSTSSSSAVAPYSSTLHSRS